MLACLRCGADGTGRFCSQCGETLPLFCVNCGAQIPAAGKFCPDCGSASASSQPRTPTDPQPAPAVSVTHGGYGVRYIEKLAGLGAAKASLVLALVIAGLVAPAGIIYVFIALATPSAIANQDVALINTLDMFDVVAGLLYIVGGLISLAWIVVYIVAMYKLHGNLPALRSEPKWRQGWTVGSWFIPLANFVLVPLVIQDLWRASDPMTTPRAGAHAGPYSRDVLGRLWIAVALTVAGTFASFVAEVLYTVATSPGSLVVSYWVNAASAAAVAASTAIYGVVIGQVRSRQEARERIVQKEARNSALP